MADSTRIIIKKTNKSSKSGQTMSASSQSTMTSSSQAMGSGSKPSSAPNNKSDFDDEEEDPEAKAARLAWLIKTFKDDDPPPKTNSSEDSTEDDTESVVSDVTITNKLWPEFPDEMIASITSMFPNFPEVFKKFNELRATCEHFSELKATLGTISSAEKAEYKQALAQLQRIAEYASSFAEAYLTVQRVQTQGSQCNGLFNHDPARANNAIRVPTQSMQGTIATTAIPTNVTVVQQQLRDHPGKLESLSCVAVKAWINKFQIARQQVPTLDRGVYITPETKDMITIMFLAENIIQTSSVREWAQMSDNDFFAHLIRLTAPSDDQDSQEARLAKKYGTIRINIDFENIETGVQKFTSDLIKPLRTEGLVPEGDLDNENTLPTKLRKELLKLVVSKIQHGEPAENRPYYAKIANAIHLDPAYTEHTPTIKEFVVIVQQHIKNWRPVALFNKEQGVTLDASSRTNKNNSAKPQGTKPNKKRSHDGGDAKASDNPVCDGCGKKHAGGRATCFFKEHEDFNKHGTWAESAMGKWLKSKDRDSLSQKFKRSGNELVAREFKSSDSAKGNKHKKPKHGKCTLCTIQSRTASSHTYDAAFLHNRLRLNVKVLHDTGAETGSYVNKRVADWLKAQGAVVSSIPKYVCSCFGDCRHISECLTFPLVFNDGVNNPKFSKFRITLTFWVIDELPFDVVIGNQDINNNAVLRNIGHHTQLDTPNTTLKRKHNSESCTKVPLDNAGLSRGQTLCQPAQLSDSGVSWPPDGDSSANKNCKGAVISPTETQPKPAKSPGIVKHVSELLDYEPAANGIPEKWDSLDEQLNANNLMVVTDAPATLPTKIYGDPDMQNDIRSLLVEYTDIFRTTVAPEPAKVPPMELKVDRDKWNNLKGTSGSPRVQSSVKNDEIRRQVNMMLDLKVIQASMASRYCQVLLTPKPNDKWRFCIDYQPLNSCSESEGWNLPNIHQMLQRLGALRPKIFAVMDLTSGYHQAPLSLSSRILTAFITFMGIFEWLRVPMGLKGAPSYFQKVLATVVLVGLLYTICELYIDDIIVHAREPKEFVDRLRKVFERLRKHKITLNPEKCSFGLSSVEYVGHTIDETGLSFSPEKLDEVLAIPPPQYAKELRSFLGLASYFRDHIQNLATIAKPLQDMLVNYEKRKKLLWTQESERAFLDIKAAIRRCPKLFFMNDDDPVFLHTDASDYGIGGYVFQIIDGKECPVAFMSKTLSAEEVKWSTIEKECYAIVFSLRKFEYLLRDRPFTLRTDHENLTYINDPPSPKVRRWKIAIQEHDFHIEHIDGEKNIVADGLSRLLPITGEVLCVLKEMRIPDDKYKILGQFHNTVIGHHGIDRMLRQLKDKGHQWEHMREHVKKFVSHCPCCQKMSFLKPAIHTRPYSLSSAKPMEILHMDSLAMGIEDDHGNSHLLVLIDSCSRWVELFPIPNLSAEVAATKLVEHFGRFGQPAAIRSDNGTQFINQLHDELYKLTGIERIRTIPHSHEENGLVERANREILRHVRSILFDRGIHIEWNMAVPMVQRILNSQKSSVTGASPAELVLTNAVNLDRCIYLDQLPSNTNTDSLSSWHSKRLSLQQKLLLAAQQNMQAMEEEKLALAKGTPTEFAVDTYVLCSYPSDATAQNPLGKLKAPWKGPMLVVNAKGDEYTLKDITTNRDYKVHISRIKPFYYDELRVDPFEVAAKDLDEEIVEKIVDHTEHRQKSKMTFRVRWLGYDERHDRMLPWHELRDNTVLHKYLFDHGMAKLIPREHRKLQY